MWTTLIFGQHSYYHCHKNIRSYLLTFVITSDPRFKLMPSHKPMFKLIWVKAPLSPLLLHLCCSAPLCCQISVNDFSAPGRLNEAQAGVWRPAPPAARARPRSWLLSACTSCTCLEGARLRTSSHATGGRGCGTESGPPSAYCGGTSCINAHPPTPSLWWFGQNHLRGKRLMLCDARISKMWNKSPGNSL